MVIVSAIEPHKIKMKPAFLLLFLSNVLSVISLKSFFASNRYSQSTSSISLNYEIKKSTDSSWDSKPVRNFWRHNETQAHNTVIETRIVKGLHDGMRMHKIPNTDIVVSELCLGTMNFGQQVSKDDAYAQLDLATQQYGINFVDSNELFPGPYMDSTQHRSERILGRWMRERGVARDSLVISTKIEGYDWVEDYYGPGKPKVNLFNKKKFIEKVDLQLKRLGTDYIDVLHFASPERGIRLPGDQGEHRIENENPFWNLTVTQQQLETMTELIKAGKIRCYGLTDETAFGVTNFVTTAALLKLTPPSLIQQSYNLLERNEFEMAMLEICQPSICNVGLMAKSPLAGGVLTGKYLDVAPTDFDMRARLNKFSGTWMGRYLKPSAVESTRKYCQLANSLSIPVAPMALSYVQSRDFVTTTIIGATSLSQLEDSILSLNIPMTSELEQKINKIYESNWDPTRGLIEYSDPTLDYTDPSTLPWGSKDEDVDPELDDLLNQGERHTKTVNNLTSPSAGNK